ncbi:RNA-binding protein [Cytobacillus suaedae]|nr:RNA-binding protein [Cytobacillus suaedae]
MSIYQHFRKEEHVFIDQVLSWKEAVLTQYAAKITDFLDPREQEIVRAVIGNDSEVQVDFYGGHDSTERNRALLYPEYFKPSVDDYQLSVFQIEYPSKFVTIDHRKILGSLMSLGVKRSKFGDILVSGDLVQIIVAQEIADYIRTNLESVGKATVSLKEISFDQLIFTEEAWDEHTTTVSSMRLDVVLSSIYNLSRQKIQAMIQSGLVKVNWKVVEQTAFECKEGDVLSLRGFGRSKLLTNEGKTKKEKWRIVVGKQK